MNTYYVAGFPVSDELYHHGILGQKWGVRRYQNPDGTYTSAGRERYRIDKSNKGLRSYQNKDGSLTEAGKARYGDVQASRKQSGIVRRLVVGDIPFGMQRHRIRREQRLERKMNMNRDAGEEKKAQKYEARYKAQKAKNVDIDRYLMNKSTGKLFVQNLLMNPFGADAYRANRARGDTRLTSAADAFISNILPLRWNLNPLNYETLHSKIQDKEKYGKLAHGE